MALPFGSDHDNDFMFVKLIVHDIGKSDIFYKSVFGLVEMNRMEQTLAGRAVEEVVYQPTYDGGPILVLLRFPDATQPALGETITGFSAVDVDACLQRLEQAGGSVVEDRVVAGFGRVVYAKDPEGHLLQISQRQG